MVSRPPGKTKAAVRSSGDKGSALVEFVLSALVWMPLLLGTIVFGINIIRAIQVSQLARNTGHMYAYGIDFTQPENSALLARLAKSLSIQQNGGTGAILLSKITLVTARDCAAANMPTCPNQGKYVFTSLYAFGNLDYAVSKLGNPSARYYTNGTAITQAQYLSDPTLVATYFSNFLQFPDATVPGQYAYVSEVTLNSQSINWTDFSKTGSYARSIF